MTEKFKDIIEKIEDLSVLELSELVKTLEEKFGVSAQAIVAAAPTGSAPAKKKKKKQHLTLSLKKRERKKLMPSRF